MQTHKVMPISHHKELVMMGIDPMKHPVCWMLS